MGLLAASRSRFGLTERLSRCAPRKLELCRSNLLRRQRPNPLPRRGSNRSMREFRLALVGAPNSGKSTLFNGLTGGRAKVANYAGVTVERRSGRFETPAGAKVELIDLPGIYGFTTRSLDERIAVDAITGRLSGEAPDALLVLVDATDLRTSLPLVLQMRALGRPMILALNMIDLAERDGV